MEPNGIWQVILFALILTETKKLTDIIQKVKDNNSFDEVTDLLNAWIIGLKKRRYLQQDKEY